MPVPKKLFVVRTAPVFVSGGKVYQISADSKAKVTPALGQKVSPVKPDVSVVWSLKCSRVSERLALLFFGDIDPKVCDPWVMNSVNAGIDIGARVQASVARHIFYRRG